MTCHLDMYRHIPIFRRFRDEVLPKWPPLIISMDQVTAFNPGVRGREASRLSPQTPGDSFWPKAVILAS